MTDCDIIKEAVVIKRSSAICSQIKMENCDTEHMLTALLLLFLFNLSAPSNRVCLLPVRHNSWEVMQNI